MKKFLPPLCVLSVALLAGADDQPEDAAKKLQGTWAVVSEELNGRKTPDDQIKGTTLTVEGDKLSIRQGGKTALSGTFKLDASQKPAHLDITLTPPPKDAVMRMILQLDGDDLKLGAGKGEYGPRPTNFDEASVIITLKREKK